MIVTVRQEAYSGLVKEFRRSVRGRCGNDAQRIQASDIGRTAVLDLPTRSETVIHKTVNVNAPPGTTVIYQDSTPVGYPAGYPAYPSRYNHYD